MGPWAIMWSNVSGLMGVILHCYLVRVQESKAAGAETKKWIEKIERIEVRNDTRDGGWIDRHPSRYLTAVDTRICPSRANPLCACVCLKSPESVSRVYGVLGLQKLGGAWYLYVINKGHKVSRLKA